LINASYSIENGPWIEIFNDTNGIPSSFTTDWAVDWAQLFNGENNISLRVFNKAERGLTHTFSGALFGFTFLKDDIYPTIEYNSPNAGNITSWYSSSPGGNYINIDFKWWGFSPLDYAQYRINNGPWEDIFTIDQSLDYTDNWAIPWIDLPEGISNISIRVEDLAGNRVTHTFQADSTGFRFRKDTTDPAINYNSPSSGGNTTWLTSEPTGGIDIDFIWVANSPLDYAQYRISNGAWVSIFTSDQSSDYNMDWDIDWADLSEGLNTIHLRVVDRAGNMLTHTYQLNVQGFILRKDTVAPNPTSILINSDSSYTNLTSVTLTISASDATSGIYQMRISNDGTFDTEPWVDYSTSLAWTIDSGDGIKNVRIMFRDNAMIESTMINDTITLDTAPPIFSNWTLTDITEDSTGNFKITVKVMDGIGSGVFNVLINYTINGYSSDGFEDMELLSGDLFSPRPGTTFRAGLLNFSFGSKITLEMNRIVQ
jgi:hypothetical protein